MFRGPEFESDDIRIIQPGLALKRAMLNLTKLKTAPEATCGTCVRGLA